MKKLGEVRLGEGEKRVGRVFLVYGEGEMLLTLIPPGESWMPFTYMGYVDIIGKFVFPGTVRDSYGAFRDVARDLLVRDGIVAEDADGLLQLVDEG